MFHFRVNGWHGETHRHRLTGVTRNLAS